MKETIIPLIEARFFNPKADGNSLERRFRGLPERSNETGRDTAARRPDGSHCIRLWRERIFAVNAKIRNTSYGRTTDPNQEAHRTPFGAPKGDVKP